jgi:hypothetical protein
MSVLNLFSQWGEPPRSFRVIEDIDVDVCIPFPPYLGGMGARANVVVFAYSLNTGGLHHLATPFEELS